MDALTFLDKPSKAKPQPVYVVTGDEDFLKRQASAALQKIVLGEGDDSFGLSTYAGDKAEFATVRSDLETLPFLAARRLIIVQEADPFVTKYRSALEKYVAQPASSGVLVLDVKTWPSNTRLAKALPDASTIVCKSPPAYKLPQWCIQWAKAQQGKELAAAAAQLLVDLVGAEMGQLDQEILKLAIYVGDKKRIEADDVDLLVGRSSAASSFKIFDAIGEGKPAEAMTLLSRLFGQGEDAMRMLGAFSMQLRRLAQAARLTRQGLSLSTALGEAGVPPFAHKGAEQQLRHLGRRRAEKLYDWLLEVDLGMKGSSPLPPRMLLERLVVQLARPREG